MVVSIGHCGLSVELARFGQQTDENSVCSDLLVAFNPKGHIGIYVFCGNSKLVFRAQEITALELIGVASALEAKTLKNRERRTFRDGADVEKSCFLDNVVRVVCLVDRNKNAQRVACELNDGVADHSVILFTVI